MAVEKTEEELRKEIDELQRQHREVSFFIVFARRAYTATVSNC